MIGAGAVAALTLIGSGLVRVPVADESAAAKTDTAATPRRSERVRQRVRYVRLRPGQQAPPGARVIQEAASAPRIVVRLVAPSEPSRAGPVRRTVVTRTRQSGG